MEKRDYCYDYILSSCANNNCIYGHVIVTDKEAFMKKHEYKIKYRQVNKSQPKFNDIKPTNKESSKIISKCVTCGKQNKHNAKFCTECGTALEIFA